MRREFMSMERTRDTGPTRPMYIVIFCRILPGVPAAAVGPVDSPAVENADTASKRQSTPLTSSGSVKYSTEKHSITARSDSRVTVSVR